MDIYEAISNRKTIRDFSTQPISPETARKIIGAGFQAPSNNHLREWHFVLLQDLEKRKALIDQVVKPASRKASLGIINRWGLTQADQRAMYLDAIPKQYSMLVESALLIVPCFRVSVGLLHPRTLSDLNPFASIWACVENILVAAAAEGIFGVTRIPFEGERALTRRCLNVPADYEIPCWIALGYPGEHSVRAKQVEIDLDERIHVDSWG